MLLLGFCLGVYGRFTLSADRGRCYLYVQPVRRSCSHQSYTRSYNRKEQGRLLIKCLIMNVDEYLCMYHATMHN